MAKFCFALKDGTDDTLTGETDRACIIIDEPSGRMTRDEVVAFIETHAPECKGRLRAITEEEYARDFAEVYER